MSESVSLKDRGGDVNISLGEIFKKYAIIKELAQGHNNVRFRWHDPAGCTRQCVADKREVHFR